MAIRIQTYCFQDGRILQIGQRPRTITSRKPDVPPKHILRNPEAKEGESPDIEVEPIAGLADSWREVGLQGRPPAPNDMIVGYETALKVIDLPLESAMQRGKWLVDTLIGLIWIVRAFGTVPIWKPAPEHTTLCV